MKYKTLKTAPGVLAVVAMTLTYVALDDRADQFGAATALFVALALPLMLTYTNGDRVARAFAFASLGIVPIEYYHHSMAITLIGGGWIVGWFLYMLSQVVQKDAWQHADLWRAAAHLPGIYLLSVVVGNMLTHHTLAVFVSVLATVAWYAATYRVLESVAVKVSPPVRQ